jgi:hypothetical protein
VAPLPLLVPVLHAPRAAPSTPLVPRATPIDSACAMRGPVTCIPPDMLHQPRPHLPPSQADRSTDPPTLPARSCSEPSVYHPSAMQPQPRPPNGDMSLGWSSLSRQSIGSDSRHCSSCLPGPLLCSRRSRRFPRAPHHGRVCGCAG